MPCGMDEERTRVVTEDEAFLSVLATTRRAARSDATVLITGETGTGKELVARLVHESSDRAGGPFVRVNCAALAEGLLESELFGHEQGAFTGAHKSRRGRFELAAGGTLFLDEIGDIPPKTQVALLRVLQEREIERVGGACPIAVDARVVSATHQSLARLVRAGRFRQDLYYRLNVVPIEVPPLRRRPRDIAPLTRHFIRKHARTSPLPAVGVGVLDRLARHGWPGNVRELENAVQRALVLSTSSELTLDDFRLDAPLPGDAHEPAPPSSRSFAPRAVARRTEREELRTLLLQHRGNIARAARAVGVARTTLASRANKHGLLRRDT